MKKICAFVYTFSATAVMAQVTLTLVNQGVTPGTTTAVYSADTAAYTPGPAGASQTWNFSGLNLTTLVTNSAYVNPSSTPYASTFPGSTVSIDDGGGTFSYYTQTASSISFNGSSDGSSILTYSNPEEVLKFPFAYGNTSIDNFVGNISGLVARNGTMSLDADAYGTLILPWGSFQTLRLKTTENYTDTYSPYTSLSNVEIYNWYTTTERFPILQFITSTVSGSSSAYFKGITVNAAVVGIHEFSKEDSFLNVYPNPATDNCTLNYILNEPMKVSFSISDILGKELITVNKGTISAGNQTEKIDLENLSPGIYIVGLNYGNNSAYKKIQVN